MSSYTQQEKYILTLLKRGGRTVEEISQALDMSIIDVINWLDGLVEKRRIFKIFTQGFQETDSVVKYYCR